MISWALRHVQALLSSAGHLARAPLATSFTVLVMALALAVPLGLDVLVRNVRVATGDFNGAIGISVYLKSGVTEERAQALQRSARSHQGIASVTLITAREALALLRQQSGLGAALDALEDNPLPHVLAIAPSAAASDPAAVENLRRYLSAWPEVESVQFDGDWVARFTAMLSLLRRLLVLSAGVLGLGVVAVVGNTVRLEIQNRRAEIEVTKLVGGTNAFVRRPFLYTGALYGLLGGITAFAVVAVSQRLAAPAVAQLAATYGSSFRLSAPLLRDLALLVGAGTVLGWLGAWLATGRQLASIEPGIP